MERPVWYVPGRLAPPEGPLARYRPLRLVGAAAQYAERLTAPGDLVLDFFCQGPTFLREVVQVGRRAVGISVNPILLLVAGLGLEPSPSPAALNAAFTRLADSRKGELPLHQHLASLYRTRCPRCATQGNGEWFAWDREARYPYAKAVRCPACGEVEEGPTDEADIAVARQYQRRGLAYHYALNRAAPADHPAHGRAAELVDLYTLRNLSALMDVTLRLDGMDVDRPERVALQRLLLEAFDRGSSLDPHGEERPRPRVLRLPARFLERNVWHLLEEGLAGRSARLPEGAGAVRRASRLSALVSDRTPAYALVPSAARDVGELLAPGSVSLILANPPRPDGVFWALCALWSGWLWDSPLARALRPFLGRRRFDWDWHQVALQAALAAAAPLLAPGGHLVVLFAEADEDMLESACLAASGSGYELVGWGASPEAGCRLVWRGPERVRGKGPGRRVEGQLQELPQLAAEMAQAATDLARACLQGRSEPTPWTVLHAAIYAGLAGDGECRSTLGRAAGLPDGAEYQGHPYTPLGFAAEAVRQGLEGLHLEQVAEESHLHWSPALDDQALEQPLADRVEELVWQVLRSQPAWEVQELALAVYAALDGPFTPDPSLVLLCLDSYGSSEEGLWQLREEDDPERRAEEVEALRENLRELGERLGFRVTRGPGWDVRWREENLDAFLFNLSPTATLGRYLLSGAPVPDGARPCLVFPGGRAELLAHKLRRDPRLARVAGERNWQFIKFRHLRRLIAEKLDRRLFEAVLGLDPIVEREGVQIPLLLGGER